MIDGLVSGKLYGEPKEGTGKNGHPYVTAKVRAADGSETHFVNVIAFVDPARRELLALSDGDSVALSGSLSPKTWTDREGQTRPALDMVAVQVMSLYQLGKKRKGLGPDAQDDEGGPVSDDRFD